MTATADNRTKELSVVPMSRTLIQLATRTMIRVTGRSPRSSRDRVVVPVMPDKGQLAGPAAVIIPIPRISSAAAVVNATGITVPPYRRGHKRHALLQSRHYGRRLRECNPTATATVPVVLQEAKPATIAKLHGMLPPS